MWSHSADALALIYSLFSHWCILIFWWQQNPWDNENGLRPNFCKMLFFKRDFLSHLSTLLHTERLFWIKIMPFKFTELSRLVLLQIFGAKETIVCISFFSEGSDTLEIKISYTSRYAKVIWKIGWWSLVDLNNVFWVLTGGDFELNEFQYFEPFKFYYYIPRLALGSPSKKQISTWKLKMLLAFWKVFWDYPSDDNYHHFI